MSPSEIGFLALGLALGITAGALLLAVLRPRSPLRPVVKVTVTPNALTPRERARLSAAAGRSSAYPMPGSPDEDARLDLPSGVPSTALSGAMPPSFATVDRRTFVPSGLGTPAGGGSATARAVAVPVVVDSALGAGPLATASPDAAVAVAVADRPAAIPSDGTRASGLPAHIDVGISRSALAVRARPPMQEPRPSLGAALVGLRVEARRSSGGAGRKAAPSAGAVTSAADACGDERTRATGACAEADRARETARSFADRLRDAQRAQNDLQARVEEAGVQADPRRVAAEKDRLHAQFRLADSAGASADEAEAAARDWLTAVSAVNRTAREAARRVQAGTEELRVQAVALERLDLEANASRITAERAEADCRSAREALAACEERHAAAELPEDEDGDRGGRWPGGSEPAYARPSEPIAAGTLPVILRVLRGDTAARERLVAQLAAGDAAETAVWHVRVANFLDAVTARAIEDGYLDVPEEDPFWRLFSAAEQREIVLALSALGFRFDGMRGFVDDRAPSARDLSLAVGYAGLDRMRIRAWPGEAALGMLFDGAIVRADLWLAHQADDLSLARVEDALGTRAAALGDVWDAWGRVRPAMLEER